VWWSQLSAAFGIAADEAQGRLLALVGGVPPDHKVGLNSALLLIYFQCNAASRPCAAVDLAVLIIMCDM
jgi:hypothetical protein